MGQTNVCVVCRRREPARGMVCEPDRAAVAELLADLPRKVDALAVALVPGAAGRGEKVSTSRTGSPLPARLDVLSMRGPGADAVTAAFHPLVRRWSTVHEVTVTVAAGRKTRTERRQIVQWHRELVRDGSGQVVEVPDDDQAGQLPPVEWVASWTRMWREHFGHHRLPVPLRRPTRPAQLAKVTRQEVANQLLGLGTKQRGLDPLADEWETRFGEPPKDQQPYADVRYLLEWLDWACDAADELDVAAMATELRALSAELARILGERPDQQWLGRCPAQITDRPTGGVDGGEAPAPRARPCGAGLWQDPHASDIECPRCHSVWTRRQTVHLAKEIRRTWPLDRRRRYPLRDVEGLPIPGCPACGVRATVTWRNVTGAGDDTTWWQPEKTGCENGCPEAERLL